MTRARLLLTLALSLAGLVAARASAEENVRITGTAAGPSCTMVAVGIVRQTLRYPLTQMSGWSRGIPTVTQNVAELWLFDRNGDTLRLARAAPSPRRWTDATRYTIVPRVLPDLMVVYTLRGCPREKPNCTESSTYGLQKSGKPRELSAAPEVTAEESAQIRACTTSINYTADNVPQVTIGPNGGPWKPVLELRDRKLVRVE